jgi:hypothetical protein
MSEAISVDVRNAPPGSVVLDLARELARHHSIRIALDWLLTHSPSYRPLPPIAQDEYCHDVVFEHPPTHAVPHWIVYDAT